MQQQGHVQLLTNNITDQLKIFYCNELCFLFTNLESAYYHRICYVDVLITHLHNMKGLLYCNYNWLCLNTYNFPSSFCQYHVDGVSE